ncbi:hypothetical protein [Nocardioides sp.]|uniref:hypothetical protein n=1 Tax=Nocardioides sp. TaxID=35761 RepID=UPI00272610C6|nr:hypothetical protein [Nocardioides sp.]MDO9454971.1 hypothetical protein [Nocardioides sp.]
MKIALAALVLVLGAPLSPASAAPAVMSGSVCDDPQYPADSCTPPRVKIDGPSRATPRTRVTYTCVVKGVGTNAKPVGTITLLVNRRGKRYSTSAVRQLPDTGTAVFRTPRLPRGRFIIRCRYVAEPDTVFRSADSVPQALVVRRRAA